MQRCWIEGLVDEVPSTPRRSLAQQLKPVRSIGATLRARQQMEEVALTKFDPAGQRRLRRSKLRPQRGRVLNPNEAFEVREFALTHSAHLCQVVDRCKSAVGGSVSKNSSRHNCTNSWQLLVLRHSCRVDVDSPRSYLRF